MNLLFIILRFLLDAWPGKCHRLRMIAVDAQRNTCTDDKRHWCIWLPLVGWLAFRRGPGQSPETWLSHWPNPPDRRRSTASGGGARRRSGRTALGSVDDSHMAIAERRCSVSNDSV